MIQYLAVAVIVVLALLYVGAKYLPKGWRTQIVHRLTQSGARQSKLVQWLDTGSSCGSGCDSCNECDDTPAAPPTNHRVIKLHERR
jgi:uncharacterized protein DUF6587